MDDLLAREDQFIEHVATYLRVAPPDQKIRYIQTTDVDFGDPATWPCDDSFYCYSYSEKHGTGLIRSISVVQYHELVHAVDIPAFGIGHRFLAEGLAEYVGSSQSTAPVVPDFPESFKAMLARATAPDDYRVAMHFVGSILERDGLDAYARFHAALPKDTGLDDFAQIFLEVYGTSLDSALMEMSKTSVHGRRIPEGCPGNEDHEIDQLAWSAEGVIAATLRGQCGDAFFVGGPADEGSMFEKTFTIDIPVPGLYKMTITGEGARQPTADLQTCPGLTSYLANYLPDGGRVIEVSSGGRHRLSVGFPQVPALSGEAQFRLEYSAPLP